MSGSFELQMMYVPGNLACFVSFLFSPILASGKMEPDRSFVAVQLALSHGQ